MNIKKSGANVAQSNEIYKPAYKGAGLYYVSNHGNVKRDGKVFSTNKTNGNGYNIVSFCIKGKKKNHYTHRLVAMAFIPNPNNKPQVNHKDMNKSNNHIDNLEWVTISENNIHAYQNGRKVVITDLCRQRVKEKNSKKVVHIDSKKVYDSQAELAKEFGLSVSVISKYLNPKHNDHLGIMRLEDYIELNKIELINK